MTSPAGLLPTATTPLVFRHTVCGPCSLIQVSMPVHASRRMAERDCVVKVNPRPAGVWLVTRPAGGGGGAKGPPEISQTTGPIFKFQTPFDSPVRELPVQGQKLDLEVTDDVTGQVKVRIFDFSGLVTSASKISMLSAKKPMNRHG